MIDCNWQEYELKLASLCSSTSVTLRDAVRDVYPISAIQVIRYKLPCKTILSLRYLVIWLVNSYLQCYTKMHPGSFTVNTWRTLINVDAVWAYLLDQWFWVTCLSWKIVLFEIDHQWWTLIIVGQGWSESPDQWNNPVDACLFFKSFFYTFVVYSLNIIL